MQPLRGLLAVSALVTLTLPGAVESALSKRERIVFARGGELFAVDPDGKGADRLTRHPANDRQPSLSPDGRLLVFASDRDGNDEIYLMRSGGGQVKRLTSNPGRIDSHPAWSPDGKRIAWASGKPGELDLYVMAADGTAKRPLVTSPGDDLEPAWAPGGAQIAFASSRQGSYDVWIVDVGSGEPRQFTSDPGNEREPAWAISPARIAFVSDRDGNPEIYSLSRSGLDLTRVTTDTARDSHPSWSNDGRRIVFTSDRSGAEAVYVTSEHGGRAVRIAAGAGADWGVIPITPRRARPPGPAELLPDLDQRAPHGLSVSASNGRFKLGFASAVDNVGTGPLWIRGSRPATLVPTMSARQLIRRVDGTIRTIPRVGVLRYTYSASHSHWHLLRFESYELRRAVNFELVVRDGKSGFCLADHYGHAARRVRGFRPPFFRGDCGKGRPDLLSVEQGSSIGYTDRYPAHFHGQNLDVTNLAPGRYVLVHRANPRNLLRERKHANNAASVLIRLTWPSGRKSLPNVRVLRVCEGNERC